MSERQVDQEPVTIVQPAEDKCRNKGIEDGRRYVATNASQLTQGGKAARCCLLHVDLHRQILITDCCKPLWSLSEDQREVVGTDSEER